MPALGRRKQRIQNRLLLSRRLKAAHIEIPFQRRQGGMTCNPLNRPQAYPLQVQVSRHTTPEAMGRGTIHPHQRRRPPNVLIHRPDRQVASASR